MFWEAFKITASGILQIFILGAIGFWLKKRDTLSDAGLDALSRLVINVTLPFLIFCQLIKDFNFRLYQGWWFFPLLSIFITIIALIVGFLFSYFLKGQQNKAQFISLVGFQNSGYLPLAMVAALLPQDKTGIMFIYLFLFLLGFNLLMWSLGVYILSFSHDAKFELSSIFNLPVIASLLGLGFVFFGWNKFVPDVVLKPLRLVGDCTLPLAMFVVGADLARIKLEHLNKKAMSLLGLAKLVVLPALGLLIILRFKPDALVGLLILIQLAVPPATSLSVIIRHYKKEDILVSQGIFFCHILSILTLPIFLSLYFALAVIK